MEEECTIAEREFIASFKALLTRYDLTLPEEGEDLLSNGVYESSEDCFPFREDAIYISMTDVLEIATKE